ncbi:hypothetical protein TVAG_020970 [Trichomonas vaginalis G3]|uniref:Uncharacterized protein n=1 Tax=Trichomonas vaginalis (strain ATCC PRA-98 / G3) TaxID=412133 RepID=A2DH79_TRIV3|nr:hypothetical protein TVAGG3_0677160 [Trichomonas vaginalis G3]EAY20152.1 hypothetical protein TVAG_020970 [Trichomonas vaginalis G3]KAI5507619.1 hypothetical protein TVAGG3_0677160 [Trichomonas vaginalis G3]|eukprot:XP_001581138.1 hypothetical protein [Trichomonas vaginalis G3]
MELEGRSTIDEVLSKYNEENSIGSLYNKIKTQFQNQINVKLCKFIQNRRTLSDVNYMIQTDISYLTLDDIKFLLKTYEIQKDEISSQVDDLLCYISIQSPDDFAQIVYSTLSNRQLFTEDERNYFCMCTIPSIFKYYITEESQQLFARFVCSLFKIHTYIHGYRFAFNVQFISKIILSYALTFGTAKIVNSVFDYSYLPLAKSLMTSRGKYTKSEKGLFCPLYQDYIETLANNFLSRVWYCMPLFSQPLRILASNIVEMDQQNILSLFVLFENFICQSLLVPNEKDSKDLIAVKKDLVQYFQLQYKCEANDPINMVMLSIIRKIASLLEVTDATQFNNGILHFPIHTYFTYRDLNILYKILKEFSQMTDEIIDSSIHNYIRKYESKGLAENTKYNVYVKVNIHSNSQLAQELSQSVTPLKNTETLDSAIATLNVNSLSFEQKMNPTDVMINLLAHQVPELRYHMHQGEISFTKIANFAENNRIYFQYIVSLFSATLEYLTEREEAIENYISSIKNVLIENSFTPVITKIIFENDYIKYMPEFDKFFLAIEQFCINNELKEHCNVFERVGFLIFYDLLAHRFYIPIEDLRCYSYDKFANSFASALQKVDKRSQLGFRIQRCIEILSVLAFTTDIKIIYTGIIEAFKYLDSRDVNLGSYIIVESKALNLIDYEKFFNTYVLNKQRYINTFGREENGYLGMFINCVNNIKKVKL